MVKCNEGQAIEESTLLKAIKSPLTTECCCGKRDVAAYVTREEAFR